MARPATGPTPVSHPASDPSAGTTPMTPPYPADSINKEVAVPVTLDATHDITHCPLCGSEQVFAAPQRGGRPDPQGLIEVYCRCATCGHQWTNTGHPW